MLCPQGKEEAECWMTFLLLMPLRPFGWLPSSQTNDYKEKEKKNHKFSWFGHLYSKSVCLSPVNSLLFCWTALEQPQLQACRICLLTQPIPNKKKKKQQHYWGRAIVHLAQFAIKRFKKANWWSCFYWYEVNGSGWTHSVKFHRFQAICWRAKHISAAYYALQQVQDYSVT